MDALDLRTLLGMSQTSKLVAELSTIAGPLTAGILGAHFAPIAGVPFGLTSVDDQDSVRDLAECLARQFATPVQLEALELELAANRDDFPLVLHLAVKLARSRALVLAQEGPLFLSVVFAVYKEHERLLTSSEHPHGEDFLQRKLSQLEWLLAGSSRADFELIVVDDGCPFSSGDLLIEKARLLGPRGARVRVLKLADAIEAGHPAVAGLKTTDESRKGGSVVLGMWEAARNSREGHVIIYTDADLSTHLGQCGLLAAPVLDGSLAAIASRRHQGSVVIKGGARNDRGKLFIYLWKGLLEPLGAITDTQCGFKAFAAHIIPQILEDLIERQFAFDIELMLRTQQLRPDDPAAIVRVPVAWFDSEALSTTTDIQPYLAMLKKVVLMYRRYLPARSGADELARFIEALDERRWQELLTRIPAAITSRDPREFSQWRGVPPQDLL
jgi:hypothetical protein